MASNKQLKGILGWLLTYVILIIWAGVTFFLMGLMFIGLGNYSFLSFALMIFGAVQIYTAILIIRKRKKAIIMTIYLLWIGVAIAIAGEVSSYLSAGTYDFFSFSTFQFLVGTIFYLAFIQYFRKSKRVKNTLTK